MLNFRTPRVKLICLRCFQLLVVHPDTKPVCSCGSAEFRFRGLTPQRHEDSEVRKTIELKWRELTT